MQLCWSLFTALLLVTIFDVGSVLNAAPAANSNSQNEKMALNNSIFPAGGEQPLESDSVAENADHHKVVILIPQLVKSMKKPKHHHHHHHGKHIPVVHTGKVIHAHHHDGKVSHIHKHIAKANHNHKHLAHVGHKHNHHGLGLHKHTHHGKGIHSHKHYAHADHQHKHHGKGHIDHKHIVHGSHGHKHHGHFGHKHHKGGHSGGGGGGGGGGKKHHSHHLLDADFFEQPKAFRIVQPVGASLYSPEEQTALLSIGDKPISQIGNGKIIQIRIPDDLDGDLVREIDIDTDTDVAVMKEKYVGGGNLEEASPDDEYESLTADAAITDYLNSVDGDEEFIDHSPDGTTNTGYRFGDGYRLAAAAAAEAEAQRNRDENALKSNFRQDEDAKNGFIPIVPNLNNPPSAYSDSYHVQY